MEKKTGIYLITADRLRSEGTETPRLYANPETLDSCVEHMCKYMQEIIDYFGENLWETEARLPITPNDIRKLIPYLYTDKGVGYSFRFWGKTLESTAVIQVIFDPIFQA